MEWIAKGRAVYIKGIEWPAAIKDSSCSEGTMQLVADALNAAPRYKLMLTELQKHAEGDPVELQKTVQALLKTVL